MAAEPTPISLTDFFVGGLCATGLVEERPPSFILDLGTGLILGQLSKETQSRLSALLKGGQLGARVGKP